MARPPKTPPQPPQFVNHRGEAIDLRTLRPVRAAQAPVPVDLSADTLPPVAEPAAALGEADLQALFDALCLAGCPRGKAWLQRYLRLRECRTTHGHYFTPADIDAGLKVLRAAGRLVDTPGIGIDVPEAQRRAALPGLLAAPDAAQAWDAWARASTTYSAHADEAPVPDFLHPREMVAFARLVIYGGLGSDVFRRVLRRGMGPAAGVQVMAEALNTPFMPALFERIEPELRDSLLQNFVPQWQGDAPLWQPLLAWLDAKVAGAPSGISPTLRLSIAESRLQRGDPAGCDAALAGLSGVGPGLLRAAQLAHGARWLEASAAFALVLKDAAKTLHLKRGIAPSSLMQWYPLSLLAQPEPVAWTQAMKFAIAESGSRKPAPEQGWGLWAHAVAARLGDETVLPGAFNPVHGWRPRDDVDDNADRLILAAWVGHTPGGWSDAEVNAVVRALHVAGLPWKADLVRQACERLGRSVPPRAAGDGAPWAAHFYGQAREAWRDALAAIEALGPTKPAAAQALAPATLQWRVTLDAEGRPVEVEPWERTAGARGLGKPKPVTLSRVKKSAQLDARDAAVARCIDASRWAPSQLAIDVASAAMALIGHPAVVLADAPEQAVDLRESLPVLEVQRQRAADGSESFVFKLADALQAKRPPEVGERFTSTDPSAEAERRNSLRIVREAPDRARLIRISPAQRRVAELVAKQWSVPVDAKAELDAALRVLAGHFQLHSDADAGQAVPSEPRLRAQLSPSGDGLQLRLLVQPFGSFGPLLTPGQGRERLLTLHQGLNLSTERDLAVEVAHLQSVFEALPFLAGGDEAEASWRLDDPEAALAVVERLPQLPGVASVDWPRGKPLRVISAVSQGLNVAVSSGADWFAVEGELRIDEQRVLGLQRLMQLVHESKQGRFVALGEGEYLALSEQLRQQLADLQAMGQVDKKQFRLPAAAAAWLAETLEGSALAGDKTWAQRQALLEQAAALQPEPPATLQAQLRGYQAEGFAWMARLAHAGLGACLADDMGLGKTVQTLALLLSRAEAGPQLVIAPTSVCGNWVAEAERFAPSLRVHLYGEGERAQLLKSVGPGELVIASYALAQIDGDAFAEVDWTTLVLDEAQALKNAATKRAKSVASFQAGFRLALTGTPVENRLADLWSIMNLLNPGLLGSAGQFGDRFANPIERGRDEAARLRLRRLVSPFLLRRTKAQVLPDLPPRTEIIHRIEPGPEERAFLEASRRNAMERVAELASDVGEGQAAFHVLAELTRLRRAACDPRLVAPELGLVGAKVQEFEQLAAELVANRHKALVFSQFTDFLALLAERLQSVGIAYQYLDGSTPSAERSKRVAAFQRGEGDLFLISLKAGGFGLNLTAADYVLIVDPWWNPAAEDQAMGRAHRIGQQRPVTVYRLVTAGSIEEQIVALHHDKRSLADGILEGQDSSAPLRPDELRELLRPG
ncbi:DEAD/DEAH box helicase [Aquabacterium sp.]|uniref:DEAD/DEAH box helicase n=1 Tax=Aquabacterium sp. TaxID=1872578 RepID=UPI002B829B0B|nr:DEAD/DEAH box helicase [Aquabacterium sp.]HSW04757.1 DEAD/DEAH box helicase [Aquabacterium sp.]